MIDVGLAGSMVVVVLAALAWSGLAAPRLLESGSYVDHLVAPALAAIVVGRVAFVALDDPAGLLRVRDLLIIRGGLEAWPGVVGAAFVFWFTHRNGPATAVDYAADAAPVCLIAAAAYEGTCGLRGGCVGPISSLGLRPTGVAATMFPVGLAVAVVLVIGAIAVYRIGPHRPALGLATAWLIFAATRGVAGFFLPRVGEGLTRAHVSSLAAAVLALAGMAIAAVVPPTPSSHNACGATTTGRPTETS